LFIHSVTAANLALHDNRASPVRYPFKRCIKKYFVEDKCYWRILPPF